MLVLQSNQAPTSQTAAASTVIVAAREDRPLRVAVISDIHANLHALESVLEAVDADPPDRLWCLGDLVGYGPRPNEVTEIVRQRADLCLIGNHDLAALGRIDLDDFAFDAAVSARWTQSVLLDDNRDYLDGLSPMAEIEGVQLFHASPRDPVWEYVITEETAFDALERTHAPVVLVGHSHLALAITLFEGRLGGGLAPGGSEADVTEGRWLLNPGSVGQPRDGDPRAAWIELDLDAHRILFRRTPYPVEQTQAEIRERELPDALAERLAHGV